MRILSFLLFVVLSGSASAQYQPQSREWVDSLTHENFWGRGYTREGLQKSAAFIAQRFSSMGLQPVSGTSYYQYFEHPVNTFPGDMSLTINGKTLVPGKDFIVAPESAGLKTAGKFNALDTLALIDKKNRFILQLKEKLTWSVSTEVADYTVVDVKSSSLTELPKKYTISIEQKFIPAFRSANVAAMVKGTKHPDSVIMITAHYDHLGGMGESTFFPGANDNASGVSLLMSLASYYAKNPADYSIVFICFAAEEAGLIGSKYYTDNPLLPLKNIRFLLNTDLAGTGDEGITVVNATEFPHEFEILKKINEEQQYLKAINARGKAANSDHYFFTEKGVPSFFFYTLGGSPAYHDVDDVSGNISLAEIDDLLKLIVKFNEKLMQP